MTRSNPWMKFYPADWRSDPALRAVSYCARGLWIECIALMHEAEPYGYLMFGGQPMTPELLARLTTGSVAEVERLLAELEQARVFSRNRAGVIYSRRMVRDEKKQRTSRENGKMGGNPTLCKKTEIPAQDNPPDNVVVIPQKPEARIQSQNPVEREGSPGDSKAEEGTSWPADKPVPEEWIEEAAEIRKEVGLPAVNAKLEAANFVDHYSATGEVRLNWYSTWRKWIRSARVNGAKSIAEQQPGFIPSLGRKKYPGKTLLPGMARY